MKAAPIRPKALVFGAQPDRGRGHLKVAGDVDCSKFPRFASHTASPAPGPTVAPRRQRSTHPLPITAPITPATPVKRALRAFRSQRPQPTCLPTLHLRLCATPSANTTPASECSQLSNPRALHGTPGSPPPFSSASPFQPQSSQPSAMSRLAAPPSHRALAPISLQQPFDHLSTTFPSRPSRPPSLFTSALSAFLRSFSAPFTPFLQRLPCSPFGLSHLNRSASLRWALPLPFLPSHLNRSASLRWALPLPFLPSHLNRSASLRWASSSPFFLSSFDILLPFLFLPVY